MKTILVFNDYSGKYNSIRGVCIRVFNKKCVSSRNWLREVKKKMIDPCKKLCSLELNQFNNDEKYYGKKLCKLN